MKRDLIIGIDAGTSLIKAVAFTLEGVQLASAARPNRYTRPAPGHVEQDMAGTWTDTVATLRDLAQAVPDLGLRAAGLAVTGQGDGTWLVDAAGEPVAPAPLWLDSRAAATAAEFVASPAHALHYASTGTGLNACQQSIQIAWFARHRPELLARSTSALHCKDWLYFRLTGQRATDPSEGLFTYGNFRTREYAPDVLARLGIEPFGHLLPPIIDGARQNHPLGAAAAQETGLPSGLPVILGYVDVICSALGGGLHDATGQAGCTILGSTGMHLRMAMGEDAVHLNPARSGYTMALPGKNLYVQIQSNMAATINIDWIISLARQACALAGVEASTRSILANAEAAVASAPPASALYHPYILEAGERGPFMNAHARAQFTGLSSNTSFAGMLRAVYEGLAFAARDCYAAMGPLPGEVRVTGGAARSPVLRQILASVLDAPVRSVAREETGAAGAAMIGALSLGLYRDIGTCAEAWVTPALGPMTRPDEKLARLYDKLFPVYRSLRETMGPAWQAMAQARETQP